MFARTPGTTPTAIATTTPGFAEREIDGERWRSFTVEAHGLRITTADRLAERNTLLRDVMVAAIVPFVVALIGSLMMLWIGVRSGLVPLERLRQALARRAPDALTPIPDAPMPRELQPLVDTLNQLLERMRVAIIRERRFTSDAAHELRTPLTALKTHLQVARITHGKDAETALDYAEEGAARLQHTLQQLLTLAQVEGPFSWDEAQRTDAGEVARLAMRDAAPDTPERIVLDGDAYPVELALPQALAVTALRNLLDNALRHAPTDHPVILETQSAHDTVTFSVCDSGPGLSAHALTQVTQRFWRHGAGHGSGLGLAIVAAITERCGGNLVLTQRPTGGLEAKLTLLRAKTT
ncbi:MAG: ATP-binding protein [Thiobacillus sp.]